MKKLENFWFYYKTYVLIGLAVLLAAGYMGVQKLSAPKPDYHIGLVRSVPYTNEELSALEARFHAAGEDINGDGQILVQIHTYYVDLADESPDAGVNNAQTVSALDADLIGNVSGIFLLEDAETFRHVTGDILASVIPGFDDGLHFALRKDADNIYTALAEKLF